jgi:hypothetical protein
MAGKDALAPVKRMAQAEGASAGLVRYATTEETLQGTMGNRAVTPKGLAAALETVVQPAAKPSSFVIGPTNTLEGEGLWLQTDPDTGVPITLWVQDANGVTTDGQVRAGVTNPLTGPGLWVQQDANGAYTGLVYYDGKQ